MATLNIVNKSPFEKLSLEQCLNRAAAGSSLLLTEDAVNAAVSGTAFASRLSEAAKAMSLYVLQPDLAARGFADATLLPEVTSVDYPGFVKLVTEHERIHSWL
jgi:tRNA 2-thiouridine synthesizing protein B